MPFYEYLTDTVHKFWEIEYDASAGELTTRYGKWNTTGTTKTKAVDAAKAATEIDKACAKKLKEGYQLSDPGFPLHVRATLEEIRKTGGKELSLRCTSAAVVDEICTLTTLESLSLDHIDALPEAIGNLVNLRRLTISGNKLKALPNSFCKLVKLEYLWAYSNALEELPEAFGDLVELRSLSIWGNELKTLPSSFCKLGKLRTLSLQRNPLEALPDDFGALQALEELDLEDTVLTTLPDSFGELHLTELTLTDVPLGTFPASLARCKKLETLVMEDCSLTALPDLSGMAALRSLNVESSGRGGNALTSLDGLQRCLALETLSASGNAITEVPLWLAALPSLVELDLEDNPITNVPEDLLEEGKDAIFEHLGLLEDRTVSIAPAPADREAFVKARADALDAWRRDVDERSRGSEECAQVLAFLKGDTDDLPPARPNDHYDLDHLCRHVLAPRDAWTFIDERVMAFVTGDAWYFKKQRYHSGFYEDWHEWAGAQIATETTELYPRLVEDLRGAGFTTEQILAWGLEELADVTFQADGKTPTSFGRFLQSQWPEHGALLIDVGTTWWKMRGHLARLLAGLPGLDEHLETLLQYGESNGRVTAPHRELAGLTAGDPERYRPPFDEALSRVKYPGSRASLARTLVEVYDDRDGAFEQVKCVLTDTTEMLNTGEQRFVWQDGPNGKATLPSFIDWVLQTWGAAAKDLVFAHVENTTLLSLEVIEVVAKRLGPDALPIVGEALSMTITGPELQDHFARVYALLAPLDWSDFHGLAWEHAGQEVAEVREVAAAALAAAGGQQALAEAKLADEDANVRHGAVRVLACMGALQPLAAVLDSERNDDVRDAAVAAVYAQPTPISQAEAKRRVQTAVKRKKLARPVKKWLDGALLPDLTWPDGTALSVEELRFLFHRQTRPSDIAVDPEARDLFPLLEGGPDFAHALWDLVLLNGGAYAKNRFALSVLGRLGDERVVPGLRDLVLAKQNENCVNTLGLVEHTDALRALTEILRAYDTKYPNVRELAELALDRASAERGISIDSLEDDLVPELGFVAGVQMLGGYEVLIANTGKLVFRDPTSAKVTKSAPKAMPAAAKKVAKALATDVRSALEIELSRLERALVTGRTWEPAVWDELFGGKALLAAASAGLVWQSGSATFRRMDAGLVDIDGNALALPSEPVQLAHPLSLGSQVDVWRSRFAAAKITPLIQQLDRPHHAPAMPDKTFLDAFENSSVEIGTFKSRASKRSWRRGSVVDAGEVSAYKRSFRAAGIDVFVELSDMNVRSDWDDDVTVGRVWFVPAGSVSTGSYTYDEPKRADDPRALPLGDVPAVVFSETFADLQGITA